MTAAGRPHTPEVRERISRGLRRYHELRRCRARPAHVDRWAREGAVAPELRPILEARAHQAEAMVQDLGGPDAVTALQRGVLDTWLQAQVTADVAFARFVRGEATEVPERLMTALNAARSALVSLGLERRAREVQSLEDYLRASRRTRQKDGRSAAS